MPTTWWCSPTERSGAPGQTHGRRAFVAALAASDEDGAAGLAAHARRRYVAAGVAVVIGVSFVVVTDALVTADLVVDPLPVLGSSDWTADAVVSDLSGEQAVTLVARARQRGDRARRARLGSAAGQPGGRARSLIGTPGRRGC